MPSCVAVYIYGYINTSYYYKCLSIPTSQFTRAHIAVLA